MARKISDETLDAMIQQESGGDPDAINKRTGAAGIAQIMADTALNPGFGVKPISLKDRFNPAKAIPFMRSYMNAMLDKFDGNLANALSAYNFGPGATSKWLKSGATFGGLPGETRNYIVNILGNRGSAPIQPAVRGSSGDDVLGGSSGADVLGGVDLSGMSQDNLDAEQKILLKRQVRADKAAKAAQVDANARRAKLQRAASKIRPGVQARPNLSPAPSGGGGSRLPVKAFAIDPITTAPVDPLATQNQFVQRLLNPETTGGLLGAKNLGATGLLSPVPRRR